MLIRPALELAVNGLYLMFKYAAIGTKKLYTCIKGKITHIKH